MWEIGIVEDYKTELAGALADTAQEFATHAPAYTDIRTTFEGLRLAGDAIFYLSNPETPGAAGFAEAVTTALRAAITKPAVGVNYGQMR